MRSLIGLAIVLVALGAVALLAAFGMPYAAFAKVALIGAGVGGLAGGFAVWFAHDRTRGRTFGVIALLVGTGVFWCAILGAGAAGMLYRLRHEPLGVYNGHAAPVTIEVDGHVLVENLPAGWAREYDIPTSTREIVARAGATVVDRAMVADAAGDTGKLVFDVGGQRCFVTITLTYGGVSYFRSAPPRVPLRVGSRHLFRGEANYLFISPNSVDSKSESETRTVINQVPCDGETR